MEFITKVTDIIKISIKRIKKIEEYMNNYPIFILNSKTSN